MVRAAGEMPDEPAVDRAEGELAGLRPRTCARHIVENPGDLGAGEIGIEQQPGLPGDHRFEPVGFAGGTELRRAPVLPDDRIVDRLTGFAVPDNGGLTLVGDADGGDVLGIQTGIGERPAHRLGGRAPQVAGVMLDPARCRDLLGELDLGQPANAVALVEHDGARRCRALVDGKHITGHG